MSGPTAARKRLYTNSKRYAQDRLGGERAYWVVGPTIRRMAVADAILTNLALQDESISAEAVRSLMDELFTMLASDTDFQE